MSKNDIKIHFPSIFFNSQVYPCQVNYSIFLLIFDPLMHMFLLIVLFHRHFLYNFYKYLQNRYMDLFFSDAEYVINQHIHQNLDYYILLLIKFLHQNLHLTRHLILHSVNAICLHNFYMKDDVSLKI